MRIGFLPSGAGFVKAGTRGNVHLTAEDRLDTCLAAGIVKGNGAVKHAVIGQGNGIVSARPDPRGNIPDAAGTVQQTVFTVQVQVDKISHARLLSSLA